MRDAEFVSEVQSRVGSASWGDIERVCLATLASWPGDHTNADADIDGGHRRSRDQEEI